MPPSTPAPRERRPATAASRAVQRKPAREGASALLAAPGFAANFSGVPASTTATHGPPQGSPLQRAPQPGKAGQDPYSFGMGEGAKEGQGAGAKMDFGHGPVVKPQDLPAYHKDHQQWLREQGVSEEEIERRAREEWWSGDMAEAGAAIEAIFQYMTNNLWPPEYFFISGGIGVAFVSANFFFGVDYQGRVYMGHSYAGSITEFVKMLLKNPSGFSANLSAGAGYLMHANQTDPTLPQRVEGFLTGLGYSIGGGLGGTATVELPTNGDIGYTVGAGVGIDTGGVGEPSPGDGASVGYVHGPFSFSELAAVVTDIPNLPRLATGAIRDALSSVASGEAEGPVLTPLLRMMGALSRYLEATTDYSDYEHFWTPF